jgi:hypothetical protein
MNRTPHTREVSIIIILDNTKRRPDFPGIGI